MNGMITYTYDNAGRKTGMSLSNGIDSFAQANYTYGTRGRIATVGNNTDTLTYTYVPGTNMIGSATWQNASINTVNTYDQYKRLTNIAVNGVNVYGYTLNDKNQRTSATLPDGNKWNYTYDVMGQLTGAVKQDTANNSLANMNYFYDLIGNRTSATENSATTTYTSNLVNQYTAVNTIVPAYDLDGNMTNYNGWSYTYNGENRLIVAENAATGVRVEADYDYMGRRIFKKVYNNNTLVKHSVFVYDGFKQIAEFDALNNNSLKASYLWQPVGLDVVLLRNNEYLVADGNKNIIQVRNVTGNVTDSYIYDPFGKVTHNGTSENPFQFSSEFFDNETGLVYYNYRYHMPELGRWINRDPIEEESGINLYLSADNDLIIFVDYLGLSPEYSSLQNVSKSTKNFIYRQMADGSIKILLKSREIRKAGDILWNDKIASILLEGRDAVQQSFAIKPVTRLNPKQIEKYQQQLIRHNKITIRASNVYNSIKLFEAYEAFIWFSSKQIRLYNDFVDALNFFQKDKQFDSCLEVCIKGCQYIAGIPDISGYNMYNSLAKWFEYKCSEKCCRNSK